MRGSKLGGRGAPIMKAKRPETSLKSSYDRDIHLKYQKNDCNDFPEIVECKHKVDLIQKEEVIDV